MRFRTLIGWALLAALCQTGPVRAHDQLSQRGPVVLDAAKAYIFYRTSERLDVRLLREVTPAERRAHEAERAEAFERARAQYERRLAGWERQQVSCQGIAARTNRCAYPEERPVEVTSEGFPFPPPELDNFVMVRRGPQFTKEDGSYSYLLAVEPGSYMLYGQIAETQNGNIGTCLCMGSIRFGARAGEIVDLGEVRYPRIEAAERRDETGAAEERRLSSMEIVPFDGSMPVPERLAGLPVAPADYRAADKVPNYFGVEIDRHPAVAGILAYERDRVIDVRSRDDATVSAGVAADADALGSTASAVMDGPQ